MVTYGGNVIAGCHHRPTAEASKPCRPIGTTTAKRPDAEDDPAATCRAP